MLTLTKELLNEPEFRKLAAEITTGEHPAVISGLGEIHRAHAAAALRVATGRPVVLICADEDEVGRMAPALAALSDEPVQTLAAREFTFHNAEAVTRQVEQRRIGTLSQLAEGKSALTVMSISGALQRTMGLEQIRKTSLTIKAGGAYDLDEVAQKLVQSGYSRSEQVEGFGQFAIRGGILDFFSPAHDQPVRCEFFGDEIDSMGFFDADTQCRVENLKEAKIVPVAETLPALHRGGAEGLVVELEELKARLEDTEQNPALIENLAADIEKLKTGASFQAADRYMELIYPFATALDYLASDTLIIISDPARVKERAESFHKLLAQDTLSLLEAGILESGLVRFAEDWDGFARWLEDHIVIMAESFASSTYPVTPRNVFHINAKRLPSYGGSLETASSEIAHYAQTGYRTIVLCQDKRRADFLREFLQERGVPAGLDYTLAQIPEPGQCVLTVGALPDGMEYPGIKLAVITEGQILQQHLPRRAKKKPNSRKLESFTDLAPGDLVVHEQYGIGRFVGFFRLPVDGVQKDYIKIAYAGTDSLYVPATMLDMVAKYIGGAVDEDGTPRGVKLSKMGGADWSKAKTRAKAAAKEMAGELIKLYAERRRIVGRAFPPDQVWQTEFEERFGYQETDDQLKCVNEIKADMEKPIPMDRLLCGDVGYGKTEVALRAVMKCVLAGCQAAILVPTTVLAQQHYVTAMQRFAGYPVNIETLSRFKTAAQAKKILQKLETGGIDLLIGTHRLLQKDIKFKKLGLLVVDEEQRFGVTHKERLKEIAKAVDVLTLSATPIPRTLNMALSGIRDMSTIEEPPVSRRPVQTVVMEQDWGVVTEAIRREVSRGGQTYYLHNRIENISRVAARLGEMLDGVTIAIAHGRMDEASLSEVMERVSAGEVQVLVCTTIIESGIDIPNVNTLIVEDADRLGLAQLHQIRGRVGRSPRRAYAYFTYRRGKVLTEVAEKRLSALREFAEFNSGFKIALRDLEIRGAGSLLGAEQSGHMLSVGYDMYLKLLEEAVLEEKGEKLPKSSDCPADLNVQAGIPEKYVPSEKQRMDLYRRIANIRTQEDSDEMTAELIDRFGDPPPEVLALTAVARLRGDASRAGFTEITQKDGHLRMRLAQFDMDRISKLYAMPEYTGRLRVLAGTEPTVALKLGGSAVIDEAARFVRAYASVG